MSTQDEIRSALFAVPAHDRATWVRLAMALKSELHEAGADLWLEWSRTDRSYNERDARAVWKSIRPGGGITIRTLFAEARRHGWKPRAKLAERPKSARTAEVIRDKLEWSERAQSIWRRTLPLAGSLGERYLRSRGCVLPPADGDLRYLPPSGDYPPSLCARVTDALTAKPISLHFTRLRPDGCGKAGTNRDKLLLAGHRKRGGVIRLWPNEAVTYGLGVAEGIETALAAARLYTPVWACIDAGNLATLPVLPGIECLAIYADHDDAGTRAAQECARRWKAADREVVIYRPRMRGEDIADLAQRRVA
ncbi:MAG: PriCT-2 domain-containing protein [Steroidobacteraceae bacterium]|nr:PriCT-2 domain-containing protein [Steroidobacteraceae bacterium]